MSSASIIFLLLALSSVFCVENGRPSYINCQSNLECKPGYCCSISPMRYSIPQCMPMRGEGEVCRPSSVSTINMTATYPDGAEVLLTDVHLVLCPCVDGLTCDLKEGVCKNTGEERETNRLMDRNGKQND